MPAEWAPHEAIWMIWPYRTDNWRQHATPAQKAFARIAEAISAVTPVWMAVPADQMDLAKKTMPAGVTLVAMDSDDAWARDTGPTIVINEEGVRRGIDWQFNAWGGFQGGLYVPWYNDEQIAQQVLEQHQFQRYVAPFILEGGSIHVDGEGTLLTTEECLLNANRNPHLSRSEIERLLISYLGVQKIIWLPAGVYMDETDGHIDNMACFAHPGEVILHWTDDVNDPQYERSQAAFDILDQTRDAKGRRLKIWKMPQPGPLYATPDETKDVVQHQAIPREAGARLAASYVNFLITNERIVFPLLDEKLDDTAASILRNIFPDYEVVGVPAREILLGGGNIHCITQQIPTGQRY